MSGNFREFHNFKFHKISKNFKNLNFRNFPKKYPKFCVFFYLKTCLKIVKFQKKNRISQVLKIVDFLLENLSRKNGKYKIYI